jgi:hypothetical protein
LHPFETKILRRYNDETALKDYPEEAGLRLRKLEINGFCKVAIPNGLRAALQAFEPGSRQSFSERSPAGAELLSRPCRLCATC